MLLSDVITIIPFIPMLFEEGVGFEPTNQLRFPVFKTGAISQTLPTLYFNCAAGRNRTYIAEARVLQTRDFTTLPSSAIVIEEDMGFEPM